MSQQKAPKLNIKIVFIDIDGTITDTKPVKTTANSVNIEPLAAAVMQKRKISADEARGMIETAERTVTEMVGKDWPFGILNQLGITEEELWKSLVNYARSTFFIHPDAVSLLKFLKSVSDMPVYTATTNPRLVILSKLTIGGLADRDGSPYFEGCFGGEEVSPGGKCGPQFYMALLRRTGSNPKETLMIGDGPEMDLGFAKEAGINQVILVKRNQSLNWIHEDDGGLYVKSLNLVVEFLSNQKVY